MPKGCRTKSNFFSGPATKRGGGGKAWPLRKNTFFEALKKIYGPLSWRGGIPGRATKKRPLFFSGFPNMNIFFIFSKANLISVLFYSEILNSNYFHIGLFFLFLTV